jgi:hypothetical protein
MAVFSPDKVRKGEFGQVVIDRTMAFDQLIGDYQKGLYGLPMNARELGEDHPNKDYNGFYSQHLEMVRVVETEEEIDANKVAVARWVKTRNPDHFHHAEMFELVAMQKRPPMRIPANIAQAFQEAGIPS